MLVLYFICLYFVDVFELLIGVFCGGVWCMIDGGVSW